MILSSYKLVLQPLSWGEPTVGVEMGLRIDVQEWHLHSSNSNHVTYLLQGSSRVSQEPLASDGFGLCSCACEALHWPTLNTLLLRVLSLP